jgi:asparagine synthase (glutamine-hydrolysing)
MCGFVGCISDENQDLNHLEQWSELIRHRGPDQSGAMRFGRFGLGTRRLSIQDLSEAGNQPMERDRYILGFNGEIYNHLDIRSDLAASGHSEFVSYSDTETIIAGLETWGVDRTISRLNGMYALAIWDKQTSELSLARDPFGIKPIYFIEREDAIYFASEIKALLPYSRRKMSASGLGLFYYFGFTPAPYTLLDDIQKVRPGERVVFSPTLQKRSETIVPDAWRNTEPIAGNWEDRLAQVRSAVERAVERQLIADVPVGVFLSGGIDSTIIASIASRKASTLHSFSLSPLNNTLDPDAQTDAQLATRLANDLGLDHHIIEFDPESMISELDEYLARIDEPVSELYAFGEMILSQHARASGVPVVLTGHGGDEIFLGYPTYSAVFRGDLYNRIPFFGHAAGLMSRSSFVSHATRSNLAGAARIWRQPILDRYATVSGVHFNLDEAASLAGLEPESLQSLVQEIIDDTRALVCLLPNAEGTSNAALFARMDALLMVPEHYNTRLDRMTMISSIEARVPFQDLELVGLIAQLSHRDLLRGGLKGMLRHAFRDVIPEDVGRRPKQTFQAPILSWISGPLAPWIEHHREQVARDSANTSTVTLTAPASTREAYQLWTTALVNAWQHALALER